MTGLTFPVPDTRPSRFPTRLLLAGMFFLIFMGAGAQQAYVVPYLQRAAGFPALQAGTVIATVYFSMMIFRVLNVYLFAGWSDRRFTIVGSLTYLMFTLVMLATAFVRSYPLAMAAAAAWGVGGAMMWTGTAMQTLALADGAQRAHGSRMGALYAATEAGWMSGAILLGLVYRACDDAHLYAVYVVAAALTLLGVIVGTCLPATGPALRERPNLPALLATMARGRTLIAGLLQLTSALSFGLVLGGLGAYVQAAYGPAWVWLAVAFYPATRMLVSVVSGHLFDRLGQTAVMCGGFAAGAAALAVAAVWDSRLATIVMALGLGVLSSTVPVVASAMVGVGAEVKRRPLVYGIVFSWRDLGVVSATVAVVLIGGRFDFRTAFSVFIWVFLACALLSLLLGRFGGQKM